MSRPLLYIILISILIFVSESKPRVNDESKPLVNECRGKKGSAKIDLSSVKVTGCDVNDRSCIFHRGRNASLEIPFVPSRPADKITAVVHGIISFIPVPFAIPNPNACQHSGLTCPISVGEKVTYTSSLYVKESYPSIRVKIRWELKDEHSADIVCIEIPVFLK